MVILNPISETCVNLTLWKFLPLKLDFCFLQFSHRAQQFSHCLSLSAHFQTFFFFFALVFHSLHSQLTWTRVSSFLFLYLHCVSDCFCWSLWSIVNTGRDRAEWICLSELVTGAPGPIFCLLVGVSSGYARPITGQVTSAEHSLSLLRAKDRKRALFWQQGLNASCVTCSPFY